MKIGYFSPALALLAGTLLISAIGSAQDATPRPRFGGFERPLAEAPRFGNPGASPKLTFVDLRALLAHWADFDANKNGLLEKSEVPELFWKLFDQADLNHDGALDEHERALVLQPAATTSSVSVSSSAK